MEEKRYLVTLEGQDAEAVVEMLRLLQDADLLGKKIELSSTFKCDASDGIEETAVPEELGKIAELKELVETILVASDNQRTLMIREFLAIHRHLQDFLNPAGKQDDKEKVKPEHPAPPIPPPIRTIQEDVRIGDGE